MMFGRGDTSLPHAAYLTLSSTVISMCTSDSIWSNTPVGNNATGTCYSGTVNGKLYHLFS